MPGGLGESPSNTNSKEKASQMLKDSIEEKNKTFDVLYKVKAQGEVAVDAAEEFNWKLLEGSSAGEFGGLDGAGVDDVEDSSELLEAAAGNGSPRKSDSATSSPNKPR